MDRDLSRGIRHGLDREGKTISNSDNPGRPGLSYLLIALPVLLLSAAEGFPPDGISSAGGAIALAASALLLAFIFWRQVRILKARSIKSGRYYERNARFSLPPEFATSEDALLAKRRRKRADRDS